MATKSGGIAYTTINGVRCYSIASLHPQPTPTNSKKARAARRKDTGYQKRVDLIQDLWFETSTSRIKVSPDGEYLIASGIHPPQIKVFELRELSLKFERHLISEIVSFEILSEDYSKLAFLCADRSICLHAKYGSHYRLQIPRMGRHISYDCWSCDLLCAASSPDIYRLNLEQGRFLSPLGTQSPSINVLSRSPIHGLVACGGEDGVVECFDMRKRLSVGRINIVEPAGDVDHEVTAVQFDDDTGYLLAAGSSAGKICIYDIRMSSPLRIKDHMCGSQILDIKWHKTLNSAEPKIISADNHNVRIWDPKTGDNMISINTGAEAINDVCTFRGSGLMLLALDSSHIPAHFIPDFGPAPKWCSHLENLTEEMEESNEKIAYTNLKILTKEELERLNLTHLIGSDLLIPQLHGFFIDYRLYKKAKAMANPFAYEDYIEKKKQEKIEAERASRIAIKRKLPKVNRVLAASLREKEIDDNTARNFDDSAVKEKSSKKKKGLSSEFLKDERFSDMFVNEEFEIDEMSSEYRAWHPSSTQKPSLIEEHFEPIMEEDEDDMNGGSSSSDSSKSSDDELNEDQGGLKNNSKPVRMYEVKDERHAEAFWNCVSLAKEDAIPIGERVTSLQNQKPSGNVKKGPGGSREISFVSNGFKKHTAAAVGDDKGQQRRSVQSLGLKPDKSEFYSQKRSAGRGRGKLGRNKHRH